MRIIKGKDSVIAGGTHCIVCNHLIALHTVGTPHVDTVYYNDEGTAFGVCWSCYLNLGNEIEVTDHAVYKYNRNNS